MKSARKQIDRNALTPAQRRNIFRLYQALPVLDDEMRRDVQEGVTGKRSLRLFTRDDGRRLIEHLMQLAGEAAPDFKRKPRYAGPRPRLDPADPPTIEQLALITEMLTAMGATARQRAAFITRQIGYAFPRSVGQAQDCIEALKKMSGRKFEFTAESPLTIRGDDGHGKQKE